MPELVVVDYTTLIRRFSLRMERVAKAHIPKYGPSYEVGPSRTGWYFGRMVEEMGEVAAELNESPKNVAEAMANVRHISDECCDVALFAACLALSVNPSPGDDERLHYPTRRE